MDSHRAIKAGIDSGQHIVEAYLGDLTDAELLVRPVPGANHIAWQLGHLIAGEHDMIELVRPGSMPDLSAGFRERHNKEASKRDDPKAFLTKAQYLEAFTKQRAGTLAALAAASDADLDKPAPEPLRSFLKNVSDVFVMQGTHWVMHAGQWAVVRRKLGRAPIF